jgi:FkbM family methyltransferase
MTGATFNIYAGLQDFEDMGFVLHVLRKEHLFIDIGANVGAYTILASAVVGAASIAFEPVPATFDNLSRNVRLNGIQTLCELHNEGLASRQGVLIFTADADTRNRVVANKSTHLGHCVSVPVTTLDDALGDKRPSLIKIDVEGFEAEVLKGGDEVFKSQSLVAVIMELNGSGKAYGHEDSAILSQMLLWDFAPHRYDPFTRALTPIREVNITGNTLFVRHASAVRDLVLAAPKFTVLRKTF